MRLSIPYQRYWSLDAMSPEDARSLIASARVLNAMDNAFQPLKDRHVAVLCEAPRGASADVLTTAAAALGATAVRLSPSALSLGYGQLPRDTARMLGRIYSMIGCDGLSPSAVALLSRWAGVPVLNQVADPAHPARMLADLLAMQEHARKDSPDITLGVHGDLDPQLAAWRRLADLTGLRIVQLGKRGRATELTRCDFVRRPRQAGAAGPAPTLIAVDSATGRREYLGERQIDSHRRLVQALLVNVVA